MNTLFTSATLLAVAAALWGKVRMVLSRLWSIFFVTVKLQGALSGGVRSYCWNHYYRSPFGHRMYCTYMTWVRPVRRQQYIGYETFGTDPIIFWKKWWCPLLVGAGVSKSSQGDEIQNDHEVSFTFVRGTLNLDTFLNTALQEFNSRWRIGDTNTKKSKRFFIRRFVGMGGMRRRMGGDSDGKATPSSASFITTQSGNFEQSIEVGEVRMLNWRREDIGPDIDPERKALDALALPPAIMEMIAELRHWLDSEEWYREKQIPWTRGWMIYGAPGTGKTSVVRALGQDFDLPVFVFDLSSMSNEEFIRFWGEMRSSSPCIALFEDIDAVFCGRENVCGDQGGGLTFDCFLNAMSGIENPNGIFKIITTNHVEKLDDALGVPRGEGVMSTRPGRCDRAIELGVLDDDCRQRLAVRILSDCPEYITTLVRQGTGDTGAQFQERCAKIALEEYWKAKTRGELLSLGLTLPTVQEAATAA
jgi:hypothetical protein